MFPSTRCKDVVIGALVMVYALFGCATAQELIASKAPNTSVHSLSNFQGYHLDLLIAISDNVNETTFPLNDVKALLNKTTQKITTLTSEIGMTVYISIKILLPSTWTMADVTVASFETFSAAQVIIDKPNEIYGDTPYTKHSGECMEEGEYVHLTPNFLNEAVSAMIHENLTRWGRPENVIVHELLHQLFGVFDEYEEEDLNKNHQRAEANVCPASTTGKWIVPGPDHNDCSKHPVRSFCIFKPYNDNSPQSIMGYVHLNTTTHICTDPDASNANGVTHNRQANTMHNRKCNFRSVASVIRQKLKSIGSTRNTRTSVRLLKAKSKRRIVVVVEDSYYKNKKFCDALKKSLVSYMENHLEAHDEVGLFPFSDNTTIFTNITKAAYWKKHKCDRNPPGTNGCISKAIESARNLLGETIAHRRGGEILVITTGVETGCLPLSTYQNDIFNESTIVHTLLIKTNKSSINSPIAELTKTVNGQYGEVKWNLCNNGCDNPKMLPLEKVLSRSGTSSRKIKGLKLKETDDAHGSFFINPQSMGDVKLVLGGNRTKSLLVKITQPDNMVNDYNHGTDVDEIILKITTDMMPGLWKYNISTSDPISVSISANSLLPWSKTIRAIARTNVQSIDFSKAITAPKIIAQVTRGYLPVLDANVTAVVTTATGSTHRFPLHDTGSGPDITKDDGIYTSYLAKFDSDGFYSVAVEIGSKRSTKILTRQKQNPAFDPSVFGSTSDSGDLVPLLLEEFERYATTPDISAENVPPGGDLFPPSQVTDLELYIATDGDINLKFTPPGDDLNIGDASGFVVYLAYLPHEDHMDVFDNHTFSGTAPTIYTGNHKINKIETNSSHPTLYFTIRFFDDQFKYAPFSNIVSYTPSSGVFGTAGPTVSAQTFPTSSIQDEISPDTLSKGVVIAIVTCSLIAIVTISVTIFVCIWLRRRHINGKKSQAKSTSPAQSYVGAVQWNSNKGSSDPYNSSQTSPENQPHDKIQHSQEKQPNNGSQGSQEMLPKKTYQRLVEGSPEYKSHELKGSQGHTFPNTLSEGFDSTPSSGYVPPDLTTTTAGSGFELRRPNRNPPGLTVSRQSLPKFVAPPPPTTRHRTPNPQLPIKDNKKHVNQENKTLQSQMLAPMPLAPGLLQPTSGQSTNQPPPVLPPRQKANAHTFNGVDLGESVSRETSREGYLPMTK